MLDGESDIWAVNGFRSDLLARVLSQRLGIATSRGGSS